MSTYYITNLLMLTAVWVRLGFIVVRFVDKLLSSPHNGLAFYTVTLYTLHALIFTQLTLQSKYFLQGNISTGYILLILLESIIGTNLHFVSTYCDLNTRYYPNYCSGQLKFIFEWKKWPSFIEQTTARADKGDLKTFSTGADEISIFTFLRGAKPTVIHFSLLFGNKISFTKIERCSSARGSVVHGLWQNCRLPARAVNGTSKNFTMQRAFFLLKTLC